jgi:DNA invertase Pin-like site-specific DNA recombinase
VNAVSYLRVSTPRQADHGAGLELQQATVAALCRYRGWEIIAEFQDVAGGKSDDRPGLHAALHRARVTGATLVVASLDRLSRDVVFVTRLMASPVKFVPADYPEAGKAVLQIMAVMAENQRALISARTREALKLAKERGQKLGNPNGAAALRRANKGNAASIAANKAKLTAYLADIKPVLVDLWREGHRTGRAVANELNARNIPARRGGKWHPSSTVALLNRVGRGELDAACGLCPA